MNVDAALNQKNTDKLLTLQLICNPSSPLQKITQEFEIKRLSLEEQRDRLQQQLDNLKEELSAKLNMANQEVANGIRPLDRLPSFRPSDVTTLR